MLNMFFEIFINIFIILPLVVIIHECGHAFFSWVCKVKVLRVDFGSGKTLYNMGNFYFNLWLFYGGVCVVDFKEGTSKFKLILCMVGGCLLNTLTSLLSFYLSLNTEGMTSLLLFNFSWISLANLFQLIPTDKWGVTDGFLIRQVINGEYKIKNVE